MRPKLDARIVVVAFAGLGLTLGPTGSHAQTLGTAFTYQGRLNDAGSPATGAYDLQLALFDAAVSGAQVGPILVRDDVAVSNGLFTVSLDFGAVFAGSKRWLEVGGRPGASTGAYSTLSPWQELAPSPNAVFSASAPWTGITAKPAGFADGIDDDVLGGLTCASGQIAKWSGTSWACSADADTIGWGLAGNAGTNPAENFIGTTDNQAFELRANNLRGLRIEQVTAVVGANTYAGANVVGPDMMDIYNGNVATDGEGYATVELPEWFEALNRDFRYQLTVLDEADTAGFVQAKVVRKVADNRFTIRTSAPRVEVSWQVTGIRQDAFAEKHRIPVEEDKPEAERGKYLHPVEHGQAVENGVDWERSAIALEHRQPHD